MYNRWIKIFYELVFVTFMTKTDKGDEETFYLHVLIYYMPEIIKDTWNKYELGIGIYTM